MNTLRYYLELSPNCVNFRKAELIVQKSLKELEVSKPKGGWHAGITVHRGKESFPYMELIGKAKENGVSPLQRFIDQQGGMFASPLNAMAVSEHMTITSSIGSTSVSVQGPGRITNAEVDLTTDILQFREDACGKCILGSDAGAMMRTYRCYLMTCVALIDAYLHITETYFKESGKAPAKSLKQARGGMPGKVSAWIDSFSKKKTMQDLESERCWVEFTSLRRERNDVAHANDPFYTCRVDDMAKYLNYVREGIGGLLIWLHESIGYSPVMFMLKLKHAPLVISKKAVSSSSTSASAP